MIVWQIVHKGMLAGIVSALTFGPLSIVVFVCCPSLLPVAAAAGGLCIFLILRCRSVRVWRWAWFLSFPAFFITFRYLPGDKIANTLCQLFLGPTAAWTGDADWAMLPVLYLLANGIGAVAALVYAHVHRNHEEVL